MKKLMIVGLCVLYVISPIDFSPDFLPVVGWGDDIVAGLIGLKALLAAPPRPKAIDRPPPAGEEESD